MTNKELCDACGFASAAGESDREVQGIFTGDLLSWAMGRAGEGNAWFTVMGNVNTVAVAALADCACVILCHGAQWDQNALEKAKQQNVSLYTTDLPEFEASFLAAHQLGLTPPSP
ncbi:hypothetical protein [uncultured Ruthenibacterium sp.]|uniref:hypothetical protein n=1 Tax=uncultured Ruthenibacterium sp. TaxID=1905347 RepID=UPI00349EED72